jgi:hypothetical protein
MKPGFRTDNLSSDFRDELESLTDPTPRTMIWRATPCPEATSICRSS